MWYKLTSATLLDRSGWNKGGILMTPWTDKNKVKKTKALILIRDKTRMQ